jgi:hypothetical protein
MKRRIPRESISDLVLGKLSPEESLRLLEEIERDPSASEELEFAAELLRFAAVHGKSVFERAEYLSPQASGKPRTVAERLESYLHVRNLAYPAIVLVVMLGLVTASHLSRDKYYPLTGIEGVEFESRVRGPGQEDLDAAQQFYAEGQPDESIRVLERYIRAFPRSEVIDYVHYSTGTIYLLSSRRSFLSLFPSYDHERVMHGLDHLDSALHNSTNVHIIENSHWLRAKAFLMRHRPYDALVELEGLKSLGGSRSDQASELISEIRRIENKE